MTMFVACWFYFFHVCVPKFLSLLCLINCFLFWTFDALIKSLNKKWIVECKQSIFCKESWRHIFRSLMFCLMLYSSSCCFSAACLAPSFLACYLMIESNTDAHIPSVCSKLRGGNGAWGGGKYAKLGFSPKLIDRCYRSLQLSGFQPQSTIMCLLISSHLNALGNMTLSIGMISSCFIALVSPHSYFQTNNESFAQYCSLLKVPLFSAEPPTCHGDVAYGMPKHTLHPWSSSLIYSMNIGSNCVLHPSTSKKGIRSPGTWEKIFFLSKYFKTLTRIAALIPPLLETKVRHSTVVPFYSQVGPQR